MRLSNTYFLLFLSMFLVVSLDSRVCFAAEVAALEEATEEAIGNAAREMADELGITGAEDISKLESTMNDAMEALPKSALENPQVLEDTIAAAKESMTDSLNAMKESGENMANALDKLGEDTEAMSKISSDIQNASESSIKDLAKEGTITEGQADKMLKDLAESKAALQDLSGGTEKISPEEIKPSTNSAASDNPLKEQLEEVDKTLSQGEGAAKEGRLERAKNFVADKAEAGLKSFKEWLNPDVDAAADQAEADAKKAAEKASNPNASDESKVEAEKAQEKAEKIRDVADKTDALESAKSEATEARAKAQEAEAKVSEAVHDANADPGNKELEAKATEARAEADRLGNEAKAKEDAVTQAEKDLKAAKNELKESWNIKGKLAGAAHFIGEQVLMITFMTIPQMMQQAIEEELNRKAALATVAQPIKFGNMVLQIAEQCVDEDHPLQSVPLYLSVPVNYIGDSIDQSVSKEFNNTIVGTNNIGFGKVKIIGVAGTDATLRYNTDEPGYLEYANFVMSYPSQSYDKIGGSLISDPTFSGMVVALNTGYAFDATGEQVTAPPSPPIVDMKVNAPASSISSISKATNGILSKLITAGLTSSYGTFTGINTGAQAATLADYFDCASGTGSSLGAAAKAAQETVAKAQAALKNAVGAQEKTAAATNLSAAQAALEATPRCLVDRALSAYAASSKFNDTMKAVVPLYGWGKTEYSNIINKTNFPHVAPLTIQQAQEAGIGGVIKNTTSGSSTDGDSDVDQLTFGDPAENYVVQGCWVYTCADTPFAKALQGNALDNSATGPYVDYVIFLDKHYNVVPLQVPVETEIVANSDVKWPMIGYNPNIYCMVSLISANMPEFQIKGVSIGYMPDGDYAEVPGLSQIVSGVISNTLQSGFPDIYNQFDQHRRAMLQKYYDGPFKYGNNQLVQADDYPLQDDKGATLIRVYEGTNCYGTSGSNAVKDILIARSASGNIAGLPNHEVTEFTSLVTDISYAVQADGSLVAATQEAFKHAPCTAGTEPYGPGALKNNILTLDATKKDEPYWFPLIDSKYKKAGYAITDADHKKLLDYIIAQREAWFAQLNGDALAQGVMVGDVHFKLAAELDSAAAEIDKFYVCNASIASNAATDWFIAVDDDRPSLSTLNIINVADNPTAAKAVVSLVTGVVYSLKGLPLIIDSAGKVQENDGKAQSLLGSHPVILSVGTELKTGEIATIGQDLFNHFSAVYKKIMIGQDGKNSAFASAYQDAVTHYATVVNRIMTVGSFGRLNLGIYAGDLVTNNFVYFTTNGLTNSAEFVPSDLFVTVRKGDTTVFGELFDADTTEYVMSLVSGQVYNKTGPKFAMSLADVSKYASSQSVYWRAWLQGILKNLQKSYIARQAAQKKEKDALSYKKSDFKISWTTAEALTYIEDLKNVPFLPAPYAMLKQDPMSGTYVRLAPGSLSDATDYTYMFFDIPNTYTAIDPKTQKKGPVKAGAIFTSKGEIIQVFTGNLRTAIMHQYGLSDDAKTLGVPMMQPSVLLDPADITLKPGQSGSSMIVSSSPDFPGKQPITMPKGYYLYYSLNMNSYYLLDVANKQWIGLGAGHLYAMDGQPVPTNNKVAINKGKKNSINLLLLEENKAGYMQGLMPNLSQGNVYAEWVNPGSGSWQTRAGEKISVTENKDKNKNIISYDMSFPAKGADKPITANYKIDNSYAWHNLVYLPIAKDGTLIKSSDMPKKSSQTVRVVTKKGEIAYFVLDGVVYKTSQSNAGSLSLETLDGTKFGKTLIEGVDTKTNVPYLGLVDAQNSKTDLYGYVYDKLSSDVFSSLLTDTVSGAVTVCPISFAIGSADKATGKAPRTYTLFIPNMSNPNNMTAVDPHNVIGVPDSTSSLFQVFSSKFNQRVFKSAGGRYYAQLFIKSDSPTYPPYLSYFNQDGYVDLQTGALFDEYGNAMGVSMRLDDWLQLLDTLQVTINLVPKLTDPKTGEVTQWGPAGIFYRSAKAIETQEEQAGVDKTVSGKAKKPRASGDDTGSEPTT